MIKQDVVEKIMKHTGLDKPHAIGACEAFMQTVSDSLISGDNVYLRGFGTFAVTRRAEKRGRIIATSEDVMIPEHNAPTFKPCDGLKEQVRDNVPVNRRNI